MFFSLSFSLVPLVSSLRISSDKQPIKVPDWCIRDTYIEFKTKSWGMWSRLRKATVFGKHGDECLVFENKEEGGKWETLKLNDKTIVKTMTTICQSIQALNRQTLVCDRLDRIAKTCHCASLISKDITFDLPLNIFFNDNPNQFIDARRLAVSAECSLIDASLLHAGKCKKTAGGIFYNCGGIVFSVSCTIITHKNILGDIHKIDVKVSYLGSVNDMSRKTILAYTSEQLINFLQDSVCENGPKIRKFDGFRGTIVFATLGSACHFNLYYSSDNGYFKMTKSLPLNRLVMNETVGTIDPSATQSKTASDTYDLTEERSEMCKGLVRITENNKPVEVSADFDSCVFMYSGKTFEQQFSGSSVTDWNFNSPPARAEDCQRGLESPSYKFTRYILGQGCVFTNQTSKIEILFDNKSNRFYPHGPGYVKGDLANLFVNAPESHFIDCPGESKAAVEDCSHIISANIPIESGTSGGFKLRASRIVYQLGGTPTVLQINSTSTAAEAVRSVCKASVPENMAYWLGINYKLSSNGRHCGVIDGANVIFSWPVLAGKGLEFLGS